MESKKDSINQEENRQETKIEDLTLEESADAPGENIKGGASSKDASKMTLK